MPFANVLLPFSGMQLYLSSLLICQMSLQMWSYTIIPVVPIASGIINKFLNWHFFFVFLICQLNQCNSSDLQLASAQHYSYLVLLYQLPYMSYKIMLGLLCYLVICLFLFAKFPQYLHSVYFLFFWRQVKVDKRAAAEILSQKSRSCVASYGFAELLCFQMYLI